MRSTLLAISALMLGAGSALAQAPGEAAARFREVFLRLDANGDTVLERDEVPESGRDAFDRLLKRGDANKDGKLQADELRALGQKLAALNDPEAARRRFQGMDKDKDGKVTRAEFTGVAANFDRIDADKDGAITQDEVAKFFSAAAQNRPAAGAAKAKPADEKPKDQTKTDGDPGEKPREKPKPSADVPAAAARRFRALDKDGDGKLSREEFPRPLLFDRLDTDKDGRLSPSELAELRKPE